ncbi:MAG: T9SS type A sorting domain-containing protein [Taibaiella sp.]|nr:T9SS type A sorting domain-containing protein [Taibaiella sp.]
MLQNATFSCYAPKTLHRIFKRTFLLSLLYLLITSAAFAQKNIAVILISPAPGANIDSGETVYTVSQLYNYSTDTLKNSDSVVVELSVNGNRKLQGLVLLTTDVPPGDYYEFGFPLTWTVTTDVNNADYCVKVFMAHESDPDTTNNTNCIKVNFRAPRHSSGISPVSNEASVSVYPNPASSQLTIQSQEAMDDLLSIYTLDGRILTSQRVVGMQKTISLAGFPDGTCIYTLSNSSGVKYKTGTLVIRN